MNRIDEIKKRLSLATAGDWKYNSNRNTHDSCIYVEGSEKDEYIGPDEGCVVGSSEWIWIDDADGEFIANAKSDIEFLLNLLEEKQ